MYRNEIAPLLRGYFFFGLFGITFISSNRSYLLIVTTYNINMNTREDLLKWLDDNKAFKDPERKTLSSSIVRILNKNENIKEDFGRVTKLDSDNTTTKIHCGRFLIFN